MISCSTGASRPCTRYCATVPPGMHPCGQKYQIPSDSLENHPLHSYRTGFEVDLISSLLEAPRETLDTLTLPEPVKIGGAALPIRLVADEDRKHTDQDGVGDGDQRALLPPSCGQPAEERRQIGLLGRRGTVSPWHEPSPQRPVPLAGCPGAPFPGACIMAGSDPGPRSETRRRPKTTHISANLGDEHCRPTPVDARNGIQQ